MDRFYDGWTYTWKAGRMLHSMERGGESAVSAQFTYDHTGLRVKKSVNGVDTLSLLNGKNITHTRKGINSAGGTDAIWMHFFYDAQGSVAAVCYNGVDYASLHNLQGDVVGLMDMDGTVVVEYGYDAWGAPVYTEGSMAATLGKDNPFRYRGYVWDEETGLYYLRSRYYDPSWGRFINADTQLGKAGTLLSHDVFSYCDNNPIGNTDHDGATALAAAAAGAAGGAAVLLVALAAGLLGLIANSRYHHTATRRTSIDSGAVVLPVPIPVPTPVTTVKPIPTTITPAVPIPNSIVTPASQTTTRPRRIVVFPENPYDFKPLGLAILNTIHTSSNGLILKWGNPETKTAVFERDEDIEYGSHYHILIDNHHTGDHLRPGTPVPEPYATIYFPD